MLMNRSSLLSTLLAATIVATGIPAAVNAAEPGRKPLRPDTDVETRITADKLTYQAEKRQVVFEGNVRVNRPDFDLRSARLTVYMKPAKAEKAASPAARRPVWRQAMWSDWWRKATWS